jgi:hypothetical protein
MRKYLLLCVVALGLSVAVLAKDKGPVGLLAASVGEQVVLADPASGWSQAFPTGTVGWLYPAPGGTLFAPDLVRGRTTVFDLVRRVVRGSLDGVTMPLFGEQPDRYMTVAGGQLMVLSYPERAPLISFAVEVAHPWQLIPVPDESALLILDRQPEGGDAHLVAADLFSRQVIYRRRLEGDVVRMALSPSLGVLAVADARGDRVCLVDPALGAPLECWPTRGHPRDLAFTGDPEQLAVAVGGPEGVGTLLLWHLKRRSAGIEVKAREMALAGEPVRLAADLSGKWLAVGSTRGLVEIVDLDHRLSASTIPLPGTPRDLVWCDPTTPGPPLAEWSDHGSQRPEPEPVPSTRAP